MATGAAEASNILKELFADERYADLTIASRYDPENCEVQVHKAVMALRCPLFESLHEDEFTEGRVVVEVDIFPLNTFFAHLYGDDWQKHREPHVEIKETLSGLVELTALASRYGVQQLKQEAILKGNAIIDSFVDVKDIIRVMRTLSAKHGTTFFLRRMADRLEMLMDKHVLSK